MLKRPFFPMISWILHASKPSKIKHHKCFGLIGQETTSRIMGNKVGPCSRFESKSRTLGGSMAATGSLIDDPGWSAKSGAHHRNAIAPRANSDRMLQSSLKGLQFLLQLRRTNSTTHPTPSLPNFADCIEMFCCCTEMFCVAILSRHVYLCVCRVCNYSSMFREQLWSDLFCDLCCSRFLAPRLTS